MNSFLKVSLFVSCFALALATANSVADDSVEVDVHIYLRGKFGTYLENDLKPRIDEKCPHNEVSFKTSIPHVTFYLTMYPRNNVKSVVERLNHIMKYLIPKARGCEFAFLNTYSTVQYFMWNSSIPECLQNLSDTIVEALHEFRDLNQTVPDWVYSYPEPIRSELIALVKDYGSPGVFKYFHPHVTLAWSDKDDISKLNDVPHVQEPTYVIDNIGIGYTGDHGSVLRDGIIQRWDVN